MFDTQALPDQYEGARRRTPPHQRVNDREQRVVDQAEAALLLEAVDELQRLTRGNVSERRRVLPLIWRLQDQVAGGGA